MNLINANSVDPDQTPRSDPDLHCLSNPFLLDASYKWVKISVTSLKVLK